MRLLANENFPRSAVAALTDNGHDVVWIHRAAPGMSDPEVLAWAVRESRILVTFDKDFGELASKTPLTDACGIILFRISMPPAHDVGSRLAAMIESRNDWVGHFSVIEPHRIRMRRLATL